MGIETTGNLIAIDIAKQKRIDFEQIWRDLQSMGQAPGIQVGQPSLQDVFNLYVPLKETWQFNRCPSFHSIQLSKSFINYFKSLYEQCHSDIDKLKLLSILYICSQTCLYSLSDLFEPTIISSLAKDFYKIDLKTLDSVAQEDWILFSCSLLQSAISNNNEDLFSSVSNHIHLICENEAIQASESFHRIKYLELYFLAIQLEWEKLQDQLFDWNPENQTISTPEWAIKKAFLLSSIPHGNNWKLAFKLCENELQKIENYLATEQVHLLEAYFYLRRKIFWNSNKTHPLWDRFLSLKPILYSFNNLIDDFIKLIKNNEKKPIELPEKKRYTMQQSVIHFGADPNTIKYNYSIQILNMFLCSGLLPAIGSTVLLKQSEWEECAFLAYKDFPLNTLFLSLSFSGINREEKWLRILLRKYIYHSNFCIPEENRVIDVIFEKLLNNWKLFNPNETFNHSLLILLSEFFVIVPYSLWRDFFHGFWEIYNQNLELKKFLYDDIRYSPYLFLEKAIEYVEDISTLKKCIHEFLDLSPEEEIKINLLAALDSNQTYFTNDINALVDPDIEEKISALIDSLEVNPENIRALVNIQKLLTPTQLTLIANQIKKVQILPPDKEDLTILNIFIRQNPEIQNHLKKLILSQNPIWPTGLSIDTESGQQSHALLVNHVIPFRGLKSTLNHQGGIHWKPEEIKQIYQELVKSVQEFKNSFFGKSGLRNMNSELLQEMKYFLEDNKRILESLKLDDYIKIKKEIENAYSNFESSENAPPIDFFSSDESVIVESLENLNHKLKNENFNQSADFWKDLLTRLVAQIEPRLDNCLEFIVNWLLKLIDQEYVRENKFYQLYLRILIKYQQIYVNHPDPLFIQTQLIQLAQILGYWNFESPSIDFFLKLKEESVYIPIKHLPELKTKLRNLVPSVDHIKEANSQKIAEKKIEPTEINISKVAIQNYKSAKRVILELGRINVFIGENGAGKSNILEAMTFAAAGYANKLDEEFLTNRGVRFTSPKLMKSAFEHSDSDNPIRIDIKALFKEQSYTFKSQSTSENDSDSWSFSAPNDANPEQINKKFSEKIQRFIIYSPDYAALRKFHEEGQIKPLGIGGEGLLELLQTFDSERLNQLINLMDYFSWFDSFQIPKDLIAREIKITDRYIKDNIPYFNQFSANEGFLFALFYFSLFISEKTPTFFAVDNIDSSLNPKLCESIVAKLAKLAIDFNKQALLTTHNSAVLDGLDLNDPQQKLFIVSRNRYGHSCIKSVKPLKPLEGQSPIRLSEAFTRGYLGGLPENF